MYKIIKRDGKIVDFDITKIANAIKKAFEATDTEYTDDIIDFIADVFGNAFTENLADADYMFCCPGLFLGLQGELLTGDIADGALLGGSVAFMNVTTYGAYPFCHNNLPPKIINTLLHLKSFFD